MDPHIEDGLIRRSTYAELRPLDPNHVTIVTRHIYEVEATRQTRLLQRRYTWTGTGVENRPAVEPNADPIGHTTHKLLGSVLYEADRKRMMVVDLGRTLSEGDTATVEVSHRFVDTGGTFDPHLGHTAYEGCRSITLAVVLPGTGTTVERVTKHPTAAMPRTRDPQPGVPEKLGKVHVVRYQWVIPDPEVGLSYSLNWTF